MPVAVELRHGSWFDGDNQRETLELLRAHRLPYVCVDMPQGHRSSVPPLVAATGELGMVRFHGHSGEWTSRDIYRKFGYRYSRDELAQWVPRLRELAGATRQTHALLNNCYRDYAPRNAAQLQALLTEP